VKDLVARGMAVAWGTMPQAGGSRVWFRWGNRIFQLVWSFQPHCVPEAYSACKKNEYQETSSGKVRPLLKVNFTVVCKSIF
jgi:hypothetical protein